MEMNQQKENTNSIPITQTVTPNKKMKECKTCGNVIAKSAKRCPACGAKNHRPLIYHSSFRVLCFLFAFVIIINMVIFLKNNVYITPSSYQRLNYQEILEDCIYDEEAAKEKYIGEHYSISGPCNPYWNNSWSIYKSYDYAQYSSEYITTTRTTLKVYAKFKSVDAKKNMPKVQYGDEVTIKGVITDIHYDDIDREVTIDITVYESYKI